VIGIEIVEEAVQDATFNAKLNNVSDKCEFVAGAAENTVVAMLKKLNLFDAGAKGKPNIVAIVDPPRAGLRKLIHFTIYNYIYSTVYIIADIF
jgi:tRNA/tmRNA/rRNA uracil-C5-methylase (TrmA/RlmC/RlmD family)